MLVMMFLGAGAGMSNAVRTALRVDREAMDAMDRKRGRQQTGAKRERGD